MIPMLPVGGEIRHPGWVLILTIFKGKNMKKCIVCLLIIIVTGLYADAPDTLEDALVRAGEDMYSALHTLDGEKTVAIYPFSIEEEINQFGEYLVDEIGNNLLAKKR
jgi:hypothetical protein